MLWPISLKHELMGAIHNYVGVTHQSIVRIYIPQIQARMRVPKADQAAIVSIVESVGNFVDQREFNVLSRLFKDTFVLDYSSLNGKPSAIREPLELMAEWASVLPGFDQIPHAISNIKVTLHDVIATATADVVAFHWMGEEIWQLSGMYNYEFVRQNGQWKISSMISILENETGSRDIFGPAIQAASKKHLLGWSGVISK